jgi:hypothetical protein
MSQNKYGRSQLVFVFALFFQSNKEIPQYVPRSIYTKASLFAYSVSARTRFLFKVQENVLNFYI